MNIQQRYETVRSLNDQKPQTPFALGTHGVYLTHVGSNFQLSIFNREIPIWCLPSASWDDFEKVAAQVRHRDGQYCLMKVSRLPPGFHWGILPRQQDRWRQRPILKGAPRYAHREF